jgi:steroid 5-alpha reductase family enzyme
MKYFLLIDVCLLSLCKCTHTLTQHTKQPNYFGEIAVWVSLFAASVPALRGPRQVLLGLASPLFVSGLLLYVSGIPMLEDKANAEHGDNAAYKRYKENTPILVPYIHLPIPGVPK